MTTPPDEAREAALQLKAMLRGEQKQLTTPEGREKARTLALMVLAIRIENLTLNGCIDVRSE